MVLMLIISILLSLYSLYNLKKSILFTSTILIVQPHLSSGLPGIKLLYLLIIAQTILYFVKRKKFHSEKRYPKYLLYACILTFMCYILSNYYGVSKNYSITIVNGICFFIFPYVLYNVIETKKDVRFCIKLLFSFFIIVSFYAIVELLVGNFYTKYANQLGLVEGILGAEEEAERFGLRRCNSILPYSSALGMCCSLTFFVIAFIKTNKLKFFKKKENILFFLLPFCVLLSGTRSQMVVFFLCFTPFLFFIKTYKNKYFVFFTAFLFLFIIIFYDKVSLLFLSIVDSNHVQMGSSSDMRQEQLEICVPYWLKSPIWGLGRNYIWEYVKPDNPALYGAESVWFQLLVDYGVMGCVTYLSICLLSAYWMYKTKPILGVLPLAFLVGKTLSIVIGIDLNYMLIMCVILFKITIYYGLYEKKYKQI